MSGKRLTITERADRQKVMMALREWMTSSGVSRADVASMMGITVGHLSTLINANRTPSQSQVDAANSLMSVGPIVPYPPTKSQQVKTAPVDAQSKSSSLRPLSKVEADFVASVALAWIRDNQNATSDSLVEIVKALSLAIRT